MKIVFSPRCLGYGSPGHPESPERVKRAKGLLESKGIGFVEAEMCGEKDIERVHDREMIEAVKKERVLDPDTPNLPGIFKYARLSAGGAVRAMELALEGTYAFSLMRPPGHHATRRRCGGFCYFNNIAIAVLKALEKVSKVCILDFDAHHGNGTQDILSGKENVVYVSLHQYGCIYPGTGGSSEGNCHNFPLNPGTGEKEYLESLKKAIDIIREFGPDLIGVSAGFDTYRDDPITDMNLEISTYEKIGMMIRGTGKPVFTVLEGGYSGRFPECVYSYVRAFL